MRDAMRRLFDYIPVTSILSRELAELSVEFVADRQVQALLTNYARQHSIVVADATLRLKNSGRRDLRRFYCSLQQWQANPPAFRAWTLQYYNGDGSRNWHDFPDDHDLPQMETTLAAGRAQVLSYVSLRRTTLSREEPEGRQVIAKIKRLGRFQAAAQLQALVAKAAAWQRLPFQVATPLHIIRTQQLFVQQRLDGTDLAVLLNPANARTLLPRVGEIHAALHRLPTNGLPAEPQLGENKLATDIAWLQLVVPTPGSRLAQCLALLAREPLAPNRTWFCHGDFTCSQLLANEPGWRGGGDFDRSYAGDRHRDLATFMASLGYDVAALATSFTSGIINAGTVRHLRGLYLDSYRTHSDQPLDSARLYWHLACAELHNLALMVKKNRYLSGHIEPPLPTCSILAGN